MANRGRPVHAVPANATASRPEVTGPRPPVAGPLATGGFILLILVAVVAIVAFAPQEAGPHPGVAAAVDASASDAEGFRTVFGDDAFDEPADAGEVAAQAPPEQTTSRPPKRLKGYRWPVSGGRIGSFFDVRPGGFLTVGGSRISEGIEIGLSCELRIGAAHAGTVVAAGRRYREETGFSEPLDGVYEQLRQRGELKSLPVGVVVDDGNGYRSVYANLAQALVKPGQRVKAGRAIGVPARSTSGKGCQARYELVRMDGAWMRVAREHVRGDGYPRWVRERIDPLRVLSLSDPKAPRQVDGVVPPKSGPRADRSEGPTE
jgi:murein DD-endopeptidase MepM/ murein hydrolase activator NlpD